MSDLIPVSDLFIFNHGMGFIVRNGDIKTDSRQIKFNISKKEINDVLKSLLIRIDNCNITNINYIVPEKTTTNLSINPKNTLFNLLNENSIQGSDLKISMRDNEEIIGKLINVFSEIINGIENRQLNLLVDNIIHSILLKNVASVEILNLDKKKDLETEIENMTWKNDQEREIKADFIPDSNEITSAKMSLGYLIQMPVWKVAYRLRISEDKIKLSGWAIIENPTKDNWENIQLSLISGNPISFIYDLEKKLSLNRIDVTPPPPKASGPVIAQASLKSERKIRSKEKATSVRPLTPESAPMTKSSIRMMRSIGSGAGSGGGLDSLLDESDEEEYFESSLAELKELDDETSMDKMIESEQIIDQEIEKGSDYYIFKITSAITIPEKEKSMIPLINSDIEGKKILYHKNSFTQPFPYQAIDFINNSEFPLETGPVTVFEDYPVGQAILEKTAVGIRRIISYSLEDRVSINYKDKSVHYSETKYEIITNKTLLIEKKFQFHTINIRVLNFIENETDLIIDYYLKDKELVIIKEESSPDIEYDLESQNFLRIKVKLLSKSFNKFELKLKKPMETIVKFTDISKNYLKKISSTIDSSLKEKLTQYISKIENINKIKKVQIRNKNRKNVILNDENRIRKNLASLSNRKEDERARNTFLIKLETLFSEYSKIDEEQEKLILELIQIENELENIFNS